MKKVVSTPKIFIFLLVLGIVLFMAIPSQYVMIVEEVKDEGTDVLLIQNVNVSDYISLESIHSVSLTNVESVIRIEKEYFVYVKERYQDQGGAGLPDFGEDIEIQDGWIEIEKNQKVEEIELVAQEESMNQLKIDEKVVRLYQITEAKNAYIRIRTVQLNRFLKLWYNFFSLQNL